MPIYQRCIAAPADLLFRSSSEGIVFTEKNLCVRDISYKIFSHFQKTSEKTDITKASESQ